jgi:hypothetical protein
MPGIARFGCVIVPPAAMICSSESSMDSTAISICRDLLTRHTRRYRSVNAQFVVSACGDLPVIEKPLPLDNRLFVTGRK